MIERLQVNSGIYPFSSVYFKQNVYTLWFDLSDNSKAKGAKYFVNNFQKKILPQLGVINKNETFVQMKYNETKCI